jgi:glucose-6-phosphate 1-dehydrogenase
MEINDRYRRGWEKLKEVDGAAGVIEKVKVLKAIPAIDAKNLVRGQFRGYRNENGVAPNS